MEFLDVYFDLMKIGKVLIGESRGEIVYIGFPGKEMMKKLTIFSRKNGFVINLNKTEGINKAFGELRQYLNGDRKEFTIRFKLLGTKLQVKIWEAVAKIPYGKTTPYSDIARYIGGPQYARAVGNIMAENPIPIVIPCHRVIGKDGNLRGFGGGLELKRYLLEFERKNLTR